MCCVAFKVKSCNQEVEMISMAGESASKLEAVARCSTAFRYLFVIFCNISGQLLHPVCDCIVTALWLHCALWQDYVSSKTPQLLSLLREAHSGLSTPETGIECIECIAHKSVEPYFAYVQYVQFTVRLLDQGRGFKLRQTSRSKHEKFISVENTAAWPQDWGVPPCTNCSQTQQTTQPVCWLATSCDCRRIQASDGCFYSQPPTIQSWRLCVRFPQGCGKRCSLEHWKFEPVKVLTDFFGW